MLSLSRPSFTPLYSTRRNTFRSFHLNRPYTMPTTQSDKRNIVVIGGSYIGTWAAQAVADSMHKTHKTILIEKNTHFQHLFTFPRFAVVPGHEHMAFVPFTDGFFKMQTAPHGAASVLNAKVADILSDKVVLDRGEPIEYDYLVLATGTKLSPPGSLATSSKAEGISFFQDHQAQVFKASRITIIGGGAVGVQMATDIKDRFPHKTVTLIHSRTQLMNNFHYRLHEIVFERCTELGINVILGDRVKLPPTGYQSSASSTFDVELTSGAKVSTELAILCTGQTPLSDPLKSLSPSSIDPQKAFILVQPTLQISDPRYPNIFALGDVAMTGGPKAARPGMRQAQVVAENIAKLASGDGAGEKLDTYKPDVAAIDLSLGLKTSIVFTNPSSPDGEPTYVMKNDGVEDMNCKRVWMMKAPGVIDYYS